MPAKSLINFLNIQRQINISPNNRIYINYGINKPVFFKFFFIPEKLLKPFYPRETRSSNKARYII